MTQTPDVPTIDVPTLRAWLEQQRPVTVLDVRPIHDRREWWIPNSQHVDAYDALWANDPHALADIPLPGDTPIITVCTAGKTSLLAARQLRSCGLPAWSLEGGMRAWSLAWNCAPIPLNGTTAQVVQIRRTGKGCLSYMIGTRTGALVIDAALPPAVYQELAVAQGWQITHVLETHIHADHLTRGRALAAACGATYLLPEQQRVHFSHEILRDGDTFSLGGTRITALRTPGHTPESTCYLLDQAALFTGDTLSLTGVGRPDLLSHVDADPNTTRHKAQALYNSLQRIFALDPQLSGLPCHTGEPVAFDGQPITAPLGIIRERLSALLDDESAFVDRILARIPPTPPNHEQIIAFNEAGSCPVDVIELEAGANRCAIA